MLLSMSKLAAMQVWSLLKFQVRVTSEKHLFSRLSTKCTENQCKFLSFSGDIYGRAIEIVLGLGKNPENEIRNSVGGAAVVSDNTSK